MCHDETYTYSMEAKSRSAHVIPPVPDAVL